MRAALPWNATEPVTQTALRDRCRCRLATRPVRRCEPVRTMVVAAACLLLTLTMLTAVMAPEAGRRREGGGAGMDSRSLQSGV